jgi:RNA polymerase sigma factor (sigma-70 family)
MSEVSEVSDEELAERTRTGDTDAYRELWQRHSRAGHTAARSFSRLADPDDLVSEAFLQILRALQRGGGPREAFRPYLYRTIRNLALNRRQTDAPVSLDVVAELPAESGDPETTVMENTITVRAFRTLPERWQTVLWYTEVEGLEPAESAPFLGLTPNGAAALAYRAREGLKKAWLQAHISSTRVPPGCQWTTQRMSDYVRNDLSPRARERFDAHLEGCTRCSILLEEIDDVGRRLAVVLFPIVLGSAAAASLLAASGKASETAAFASATAPEPSSSTATTALAAASGSRRGVLVAAATAGVLALGLAAVAASGVFSPPTSAPEVTPDAEVADPSPDPRPSPDPTTSPDPVPPPPVTEPPPTAQPTPPPAQPPTSPPPAPPPPPAPDVTAPAAASIATPLDGALGNDPRPPIAGSGEPNARVEIERIVGPGATGAILTALVSPYGEWSVIPADAFPDGAHTLRITQVDAAGNRSAPVQLDLTIDTVALAPTVAPIAAPQLYLPTLSGTAEPLATVELQQSAGTPIGTVVAAADGTWSFPLPDPGPVDSTVAAVQTDPAGNRSEASVPEPIVLLRPEISVPAQNATIPSTGGATAVDVHFGGVPDERVQVLIDGVATGNIHTLTTTPLVRTTLPLADGVHTIEVRYFDPDTGAMGSKSIVTFTLEG